MAKFKNFLIKIKPSRRKIIQLYAALLYNAQLKGFVTGKIYTGKTKKICVPGMNCYSCPGAVGACPLGSLQNALSESKTKTPTYVLGIILLYCITLGRTICGWLCPAGFLQELLYKIKTPKVRKSKITRILSYLKYVLLFALVIIIPLQYGLQKHNIAIPAFCKYVCPIGTFEGATLLILNKNNADLYPMLGSLFTWKFTLLVLIALGSIFVYRLFCRFLCPLGAIYGLFNKLAILGYKVNKDKCNHCGACVSNCKMDVKSVGDSECIQCGECKKVCHANAINFALIKKELHKDDDKQEVQIAPNKKDNRRLITNIVSISLLSVLLVGTIVYTNIPSKNDVYAISSTVSNYSLNLTDGGKYNLNDDSNVTLLYFYESIDSATLDKFVSYQNDFDNKLSIVCVSTYNNKDVNKSLLESYNSIISCYDSANYLAIKKFNKNANYPVYVSLDQNDKVLAISNQFDTQQYQALYISYLGNSYGNQLGEYCINKELNYIGKEGSFSLFNNKGKITVINFWATWCGPCVAEIPGFENVYNKYSDYIDVIAIHEGESYDEDVLGFINASWPNYNISFAYDNNLSGSYYYNELGGKGVYPMTFIVDIEGKIVYIRNGSLSEDELEKVILENLKELN